MVLGVQIFKHFRVFRKGKTLIVAKFHLFVAIIERGKAYL